MSYSKNKIRIERGIHMKKVLKVLGVLAAIGAVVELVCQIILSPLGFKIAQNWRKNGVGQEYIDLVEEAQEVNMTHKETV